MASDSAGVAGHRSTNAIASVCKLNESGRSLFDHGSIRDGDVVQVRQILQEEVAQGSLLSASESGLSAHDSKIYCDSVSTFLKTQWSCPLRQYLTELSEVTVSDSALRVCIKAVVHVLITIMQRPKSGSHTSSRPDAGCRG